MPKVKLTPEEKKALKAEKKAAKKLRAIEKKKQIKRDYLSREIKYGEVTLRKHEMAWRQMLINISLPKMKEDLEFAWHNFERVVDCKNFTISLLMDELRDAEQQYIMNSRNHMEHIDKLIDLFRTQVEDLNLEHENNIAELAQEWENLANDINESASEDDNYLKTMIYKLEIAWKEQKQNVRAEYFSKLEEEGSKYVQLIHRLKGILEKKLNGVLNETQQFLHDYEDRTKARKKEHDALKIQDDSVHKLLIKQLEKLRQMTELIKRLRSKYVDSQLLLGSRLEDIQGEYDYFTFAFNGLKKKLEKDRETDFSKIKILTVNYNMSMQYLEKLKEKGEHILHAAQVCRKLETQEEKIMPFPIPADSVTVSMEYQQEYLESMDLFWQRVAQADASRYAINEEREFLRTENQILRLKLQTYCQCIISPVTIPDPKAKAHTRGMYITEGVLELAKYKKQNCKQFYGTDHNISDGDDDVKN